MPDWREVAILKVNNLQFHDWESVWVKINWADGWPEFRFTCAERDPVPDLWKLLQFRPGDRCSIWLGGQQAINGVILNRQVAYDATNHGVQLYGRGLQWAAASSSVDSKDGSYDNMTFEQIARKVLAPYPSGIQVIGKLDPTPFEKMQAQPGELIFDFLERLARPRGIVMGSDHLGNHLLIGEHVTTPHQELIEGYNILKLQSVWNIEWKSSNYTVIGQAPANDQRNMRAASELEAIAAGTSAVYKQLKQVAEQPVTTPTELQMRANYEAIWREGSVLNVTVTVQGWLRDGSNLWRAGDSVFIHSPMAILDMVLKIQTVTYTQDSKGGTLTVLELVLPWFLRDGTKYTTASTAERMGWDEAGFSGVDWEQVNVPAGPPEDPPKDETKDGPEITEPQPPPRMPEAGESGTGLPPDSSFIGAP